MVRSHRERVDDINNAIKDIYFSEDALEKAEQSKDEATANLCFQAILYNLIIIGESVKNLDNEFILKNSRIDWQGVGNLRNLIAHEYFRIEVSKIRLYIDKPLSGLAEVLST